MNIDFGKYQNFVFSEIFDHYGIDNGEPLMKLIRAISKQKLKNLDITFEELFILTKKTLIITGSDIRNNQIKYFCHEETPKMKVLDAIRITISYPIVFHPIIQDDSILVDGSVLNPYPIDYCKDVKEKIGILLYEKNRSNNIESFEDYLMAIINCMIDHYEKHCFKEHEDSTIFIECNQIHPMKFEISKEDKLMMYYKGIDTAIQYLVARDMIE